MQPGDQEEPETTSAEAAGSSEEEEKRSLLEEYEREVGAVVLRGNRMVLVRSLKKEFEGLRVPSLPIAEGETPVWSVPSGQSPSKFMC